MRQNKGTHMNGRALASFFLVFSFLSLAFSGIILHKATEQGFQAAHLPMSVHNASAAVFAVAAITHGVLNRKIIGAYGRRHKREIALSLLCVALFVFFAAAHTFVVG